MRQFLNEAELKRLAPYEGTFDRVCHSGILRGVGSHALGVMQEVWRDLTGRHRDVNGNCANCVFDFLKDVGNLYFDSLKEIAASDEAARALAEEAAALENIRAAGSKKRTRKAKK